MPLARSQAFSQSQIQPVYYVDMVPGMDLNPFTGLIATVDNEQAVGQSLELLILTNQGERPLDNIDIGSRIFGGLFEQNDPVQLDLLRTTIIETIQKYEPRAILQQVTVQGPSDTLAGIVSPASDNQVQIQIVFSLINIPNVFNQITLLKRIN
jgi:phage baseplate assembly protein W